MLSTHRGRNMRTSLDAVQSPTDEAVDAPATVLPSSTELFYFYGQILEQCSKLFERKFLKKCAGCAAAFYCSKSCQTRAWKEKDHRTQCKNAKTTGLGEKGNTLDFGNISIDLKEHQISVGRHEKGCT